jgi:ligand-binding sensor domain-containing protein/two-component sensor histidine kinase
MRRKEVGNQRRIRSIGKLNFGRWLRLCSFPLLSILPFAWSSVPEQTAREYVRTLWRVSDGLPENTVQAIVASSPRQLWIGTSGGLVRFDGAHMLPYGNDHERHVPVHSIFCLTVTRNGVIWAGTEGGGLLRIDNSGWRAYSHADGLDNGFVRTVFEDSRGTLWVGTDDGLFQRHGDRFERQNIAPHSDRPDASPFSVHAITEDHAHRLWIGGSELSSIAADGRVTAHHLFGTYSQNRVKTILEASDGTIWVGTVGGIEKMADGRFHLLPGLRATVRHLMQSDDGTLWIATIGNGLWTWRDGALARVDSSGLLPSDTVLYLFNDSAKQIWVGTQDGLVRLSHTSVHIITLPGTGDPDTETIFGDTNGRIWVAARYLYTARGDTAYRADLPQIGELSIRNVFRARDGALWVGTDGSGVFRLHDGISTHLLAPAQLTNNFIRAFLETPNGELWIATDEGVTRLHSGNTEKLTEASGLAYFSTRSLLEDRTGNIWIGTDRGLSRWTAGRFVQDEVTAALSQEKIWSILEDRHGALWFGTRDHGLFRYANAKLVHITTSNGLPTNSIYAVLQDRSGTFWITGPNTISSIAESAMDAVDPSTVDAFSYSMPFAADGAQLYGGRQPAGFAAPDGSMWFPTNRGVARVRTTPLTPPPPQPQVLIDAVREDGVGIPFESSLNIPARVRRITFAFSAASLQPQEGLHFRWKLEGFDKDWTAAGAARTATYTNLPVGHYRFRVAAFDPAQPGLLAETETLLVKVPFFYQTWWFCLLCAVGLTVLGWILYRMHIRQMAKRFAAVLKERERVAREVHDTVIQGCTGISALLEALATINSGNLATSTQTELLDCARDQARRTIDEARRAVWNLRRPDNDVDLVEALRGVADQTMRDSANSVQLQHNVPRLEMEASPANEILMIVREALCNAVRHSGSKTILVDLRNSQEELTLSIRDYGCGIQRNHSSAGGMHYGIVGMQERMRRLGGGLHIDGKPGVGTTVRLQLRWGNIPKTSTRD